MSGSTTIGKGVSMPPGSRAERSLYCGMRSAINVRRISPRKNRVCRRRTIISEMNTPLCPRAIRIDQQFFSQLSEVVTRKRMFTQVSELAGETTNYDKSNFRIKYSTKGKTTRTLYVYISSLPSIQKKERTKLEEEVEKRLNAHWILIRKIAWVWSFTLDAVFDRLSTRVIGQERELIEPLQ